MSETQLREKYFDTSCDRFNDGFKWTEKDKPSFEFILFGKNFLEEKAELPQLSRPFSEIGKYVK